VTKDRAYLFTDGRYFLQAEKQLDKSVQIVLRSAGLRETQPCTGTGL